MRINAGGQAHLDAITSGVAVVSGAAGFVVSFHLLGVPLIYAIIAASCALFAALCLETYSLRARETSAILFEEKMNLRGRRWRAERNFYISFMFLSCSVLANRVRLLLKEMDALNEEIREIRRR